MLRHIKAKTAGDFFKNFSERPEYGVYFYRINGYSVETDEFIHKYYEAAKKNGAIIEGKLQNPDDKSLAYYTEIMGKDFQMSSAFISFGIKRWLPKMNDAQVKLLSDSVYECLNNLRASGKNDNILKNAFIKFMCWLYYKFERVVCKIGGEAAPKVLYEGEVSQYELLFLNVLAQSGCDILLLQYNGDAGYLKLDPNSSYSDDFSFAGLTAFPKDYSLKRVQADVAEKEKTERMYGPAPSVRSNTNTWITCNNTIEAALTPVNRRGSSSAEFYNCFCIVYGVEDELNYLGNLHKLYKEMKSAGREVLILEKGIPVPTIDEIAKIKKKNKYEKPEDMMKDLADNIVCPGNPELQRLAVKAFLDIMISESKKDGMNLNKLLGRGVYLVCWIRKYIFVSFANWKMPNINAIIYMGGCKKESEAMFIRLAARLPVDMLVFVPNLKDECVLKDPELLEERNSSSIVVDEFPREKSDFQIGTSAYQAERELDTLMYRDSGMYRNQQYGKANAVVLRTMYEEIPLLWREEVKYRTGFGVNNGAVDIPVIFAKVSGVKNGDTAKYWNSIRELMSEDVYLIDKAPYIAHNAPNPIKPVVTEFIRNGKLQRDAIKNHKEYRYGFLREEMQDHVLDKLQYLIDHKIIKGTGENGTEYAIIATVLNLDKELVRKIHGFDFTKRNPKLIYINVGENVISPEDSIIIAFLSLIGFDIVLFVPTGYQSVERYFNSRPFEEHQIGDYLYDLQVPRLDSAPHKTGTSWIDRILKKG